MRPGVRLLRWMVLLGYVLVAGGLPLPVGNGTLTAALNPAAARRLAGKDRSQPFPCMDSPCGCTTAAQCFESCCCHTPAELLAWATQRSLSIDVLQSLQRRVAGDGSAHAATPPLAACGELTADEAACGACCCEAAPAPETVACCSERDAEAATGSCCEAMVMETGSSDVVPLSKRMVVLQAMRACGGLASEWLACGCAPLPEPTCVEPLRRQAERRICLDESPILRTHCVEPPPPRVG